MPDWSKAPDWAYFWARCQSGGSFWLEYPVKENPANPSGIEYRGGRVEFDEMPPMVGIEQSVRP